MEDWLLLIESLPSILSYLVQGFIFVSIFEYVNYKNENIDIKNLVFKSIIASFVLQLVFNKSYGNRIEDVFLYNLVFTVFTLVIVTMINRLFQFRWFEKVVQVCLSTNRNTKKYIWEDIIDKNKAVWLTVYDNERKRIFRGIVTITHDFSNTPIVILTRYSVYGVEDNVENKEKTIIRCEMSKISDSVKEIEDNYDNHAKRLVLDLSKYNHYQLEYEDKSEVVQDTQKRIKKENKKQK